MAKNGKNGIGGLLALGAGLAAFALLRQGQATAKTLTTARLTGFEPKGWNGTTLSGVAQVEFNNTDVTREVQLEKLGLDITYNGTSLGTAHLVNTRALAANQNTTLPIPVTLNIGSLFTQLALTGKLPSLKTFTSAGKILSWLQANIATESLRMQGTAQVNSLQVSFDQELPLADYLPDPPRPAPVEQLPGRSSVVKAQQVRPGVPAKVSPVAISPATTGRKLLPTVVKAGKTAGALVRKTVPLVRQAVTLVRQAGGKHKPQAVAADRHKGKRTSGKQSQAPTGHPLPYMPKPVPYS